MPSLVQTGGVAGPGYPLVFGDSAIVALGNSGGAGANVLMDSSSDTLLDESGGQLLDES